MGLISHFHDFKFGLFIATRTPSNCRFEIADAESEWIYCEVIF